MTKLRRALLFLYVREVTRREILLMAPFVFFGLGFYFGLHWPR